MKETRRGMMKSFLYESLRELMLKNLFEKITIKQICDRAGVIRATFYNYFEDKYDCLNAIVYHDIVENAELEEANLAIRDRMERIIVAVHENRAFYRMAYAVTGQNGFEDMVRANIAILTMRSLEKYRKVGVLEHYGNEILAQYYAQCIEFCIREFVFDKNPPSVNEMCETMRDLMTHSLSELLEGGR